MGRFRNYPLLPLSYYCYYCWPYLNWAIAVLALIIVVAAYLVNYNTIHNRRRLAREQFGAMMKMSHKLRTLPYKNLPMGIALVNKQGTLVWNNSVLQTGLR